MEILERIPTKPGHLTVALNSDDARIEWSVQDTFEGRSVRAVHAVCLAGSRYTDVEHDPDAPVVYVFVPEPHIVHKV